MVHVGEIKIRVIKSVAVPGAAKDMPIATGMFLTYFAELKTLMLLPSAKATSLILVR